MVPRQMRDTFMPVAPNRTYSIGFSPHMISGHCFLLFGSVLLVADLLHPIDDLAVEPFLNGDMRHGRGRCGPMPMLLARREPDHVTRPDRVNGAAPALGQ